MEKIIEKIKQKANWLKSISLSTNSYCHEEAELFVAAAERIEELEDALQRIDNWAKAYPLSVFPEPDFKKAAEVLKAAGLSLDAISASNMRHVITQVKDIVEQALKRE